MCEKCNATFKRAKSLKAHIKSVHDKIFDFPCNLCSNKYNSRTAWERHQKSHTGERPYKVGLSKFMYGRIKGAEVNLFTFLFWDEKEKCIDLLTYPLVMAILLSP